VKLSRPLVIRLAILLVLVAVAVVLFLRTVPRVTRYRAVDAVCAAVDRGEWQTAIDQSEGLTGPDPAGLRAAQCRCRAMLATDDKDGCVDLLEGLLDDPRTGDWLPAPELTGMVVALRGERGQPQRAAELAHRGALEYPQNALLLMQELVFRSQTEDEQSVLQEMEKRIPEAGPAAPLLRLRLAERYLTREEWDAASELIGHDPDAFPSELAGLWFSVETRVLAGQGNVQEMDATFDEWRRRGGDALTLKALHALLRSLYQLDDPGRSTLDMLRDVVAHGDELNDEVLLRRVYRRLIGTLVVSRHYDEALKTYDDAVAKVGELGMITREDILRSETRTLLGEDRLAALRGTVRLHVDKPRPGDTLLVTPDIDQPEDTDYVALPVPASGTVEVDRGIGTWPQRWVLHDAAGRVAGSGAVWPRPESPVDVTVERRVPEAPVAAVSLPLAEDQADEGSAAPAGGRRVFQVILDCADWRLVQYGRARGELPFFDRAIRDGRRTVLDSVPPFTAVAVAKLVYPEKVGIRSVTDLVHQLGGEIEGLNFVGRNPFGALDWVLPAQRQLFETFAEHGYSTVNLLRSHGLLKVGRQAQILGPGDTVRQLEGYEGSRALTPDEEELLGNPSDVPADLLAEMAADFDVLDRLAEEETIDFVALRVASLDLMTHSQFQTMNRTEQDDGDVLLYRVYRYMDHRLAGLARRLHPGDALVVMSDHGIRTPMEHDRRALFVAVGDDVRPGRIEGSPPIRQVTGWIADLMGVPTEWPGARTADWITRPPAKASMPNPAARARTAGPHPPPPGPP